MKTIEIAPRTDAWVRNGNIMTAPCGNRIYTYTIKDERRFSKDEFASIGEALSCCIFTFSKSWQVNDAMGRIGVEGELTFTENKEG